MAEICFGCFNPLKSAGACPNCGYDPAEDIGKYPSALRPSALLNGRYVLGRVMGQGGFGITYAAQDLKTGERVAVKEYFPAYMASREADGSISAFSNQAANFEHGKERFLEEANALVEFRNNPHIVNVYDLFQANGTVYFVMEFVQGRNLRSYVKMMGGRLGEEAANRILLPIMEALEEVHAKGLVHRDIAPDNIIVTAEGSAKLIDFGAARYSTGEKSLSLDVVLKHGYAPQEQYMRRGRQGPFTDVYAMAATYYYAVTGRVPPDAIERSAADGLYTPSALGVKLSSGTEKAVLKALNIQPAGRFQSMAELARAIRGEKAPAAEVKKVSSKSVEELGIKKKKKSRKPLIAVLAALLAVGLLIAVLSLKKPEENWRFDEKTAVLTVRGEGSMKELFLGFNAVKMPWSEYNPQIEKVIIEDGITSIHTWAFDGCTELKEISIPDSVTVIAYRAFAGCSSLREISIPDSVRTIEGHAFDGCSSLSRLQIPDSVTCIEANAFMNCTSLTSVVISGNITGIGENIFSGCTALSEIVFPEGLESIGTRAFYRCESLATLIIPDSCVSIDDFAFSDCTGLETVFIPEEVSSIGEHAFISCRSLSHIYYGGTQQQWEALGVSVYPETEMHYNVLYIHDFPR